MALVAPRGLFRDSLAHVVARFIEDVRLECYEAVEDVVFGPARLGLISFDPLVCRPRGATGADRRAERPLRRGGGRRRDARTNARRPRTGLGALGVAGVVSLSAGMDVAVAAIHLMSVGGYCLPPEIPAPAKSTAATGAYDEAGQLVYDPSATVARAPFRYGLTERECNLTAREYDVLRSLREGHQNKIIAHQLGISESTVKVHLAQHHEEAARLEPHSGRARPRPDDVKAGAFQAPAAEFQAPAAAFQAPAAALRKLAAAFPTARGAWLKRPLCPCRLALQERP